jgi:hypothetical protein
MHDYEKSNRWQNRTAQRDSVIGFIEGPGGRHQEVHSWY